MDIFRPLAAMALVFGLLAFALWALRRRGLLFAPRLKSGGGQMAVIERISLTPQHALYLVRVAEARLVIGVHAGGCTLLERLP